MAVLVIYWNATPVGKTISGTPARLLAEHLIVGLFRPGLTSDVPLMYFQRCLEAVRHRSNYLYLYYIYSTLVW